MNEKISFLIGSISIDPNATKHTPKDSPNRPIDSILVEQEILARFQEKMELRTNDTFQVNSLNNLQGYYLDLLSVTSYGFVEMGANIGFSGTCTVNHFLTHNDSERFNKRKNDIQNNDFLLLFEGFNKNYISNT